MQTSIWQLITDSAPYVVAIGVGAFERLTARNEKKKHQAEIETLALRLEKVEATASNITNVNNAIHVSADSSTSKPRLSKASVKEAPKNMNGRKKSQQRKKAA